MEASTNDHLVLHQSPDHPANLICSLCRDFYKLGWVTGTGGGLSIRQDSHVYIAPSGVQKERIRPEDIFVMDFPTKTYIRRPPSYKPSACTPLFMASFTKRGAGACIHTHSQAAVLCSLLYGSEFRITGIEQIKAIPKPSTAGYHGFYDMLRIPIIENTAQEEELTESLEIAIDKYPDSCAVLVRRHGVYVWGNDIWKAKTQAESLDYLFQIAVEMFKLNISPSAPVTPVKPEPTPELEIEESD